MHLVVIKACVGLFIEVGRLTLFGRLCRCLRGLVGYSAFPGGGQTKMDRKIIRNNNENQLSSSTIPVSPRHHRPSIIIMKSSFSDALQDLTLDKTAFLALLEKLIGEARHVQQSAVRSGARGSPGRPARLGPFETPE